jgi:23S rRNA pseudouridine2605 synthase
MSKLGYCSRSQASILIRQGRVRLNGAVRKDPETPVNMGRDRIAVDQTEIAANECVYLMMNKPRGVVTTASDEKGRDTIYSILAEAHLPWVAPVGRLDKASEGLLLLTNDSEWGARVAAPESHLDKVYHVQIGALAEDNLLRAMVQGIRADDYILSAKSAKLLRTGEKNCWLEISLQEGKNRQIRRMLDEMGIEVLRLVRIGIGPLQLGNLSKGSFRQLAVAEKRDIDHALARRISHLPARPTYRALR